MAGVTSSRVTRIVTPSRTKQVQAQSTVQNVVVAQSTGPEIIEIAGSNEDPGDLTLLFENGLV